MRALLIQKDVKPGHAWKIRTAGLRALLIQKDVKLEKSFITWMIV